MTTRILDATLVINAQDKTAAGLERVVKRVEGAVKSIEGFRKAQEKFAGARAAFQKAQSNVEAAARAMAAVEKPTKAMEAAYRSAQRAVSEASRTFEAQKSVLIGTKRELEGMGVAVGRLASEQGRLEAMSKHATAALERQARARARIAKVKEAGRLVAGGLGLEAGHLAWEAGRSTVDAVAQQAHERVRMKAAGMSSEEIEGAEAISGRLTGKYTTISSTKIMHLLRNARANVGSYEEAGQIIEPLLRAYTVAMGSHPERHEELESEFDLLVKGMEIKGITQDLPRFVQAMEMISHAMNAFGDTVKPSDFYESIKYGRQASQNLSDEFLLLTVGPTIAQEMKGSSAGKAYSTAYQELIGGAMKQRGVQMLEKFGMLDDSKVIRTSTGATKGFEPGAVMGSEIFKRDPYEWVNKVMIPQLAKYGITDPNKIQDVISAVFASGTAAQLMTVLATQQPRIEKDRQLTANSMGLSAADVFLREDPLMGMKSVTEQFTNLLAAAGSPLAKLAAESLNSLAGALNALGEAAKDHPVAGTLGLGAGLGAGVAAGTAGAGLLWGLVRKFFSGAPGTSSDVLGRMGPGIGGRLAAAGPSIVLAALVTALLETIKSQPAGEGDSDELKRRLPDMQGGNRAGDTAPPTLSGNATLDIRVTADGVAARVDNRIPGVAIRSTGNVGKGMSEATSAYGAPGL